MNRFGALKAICNLDNAAICNLDNAICTKKVLKMIKLIKWIS